MGSHKMVLPAVALTLATCVGLSAVALAAVRDDGGKSKAGRAKSANATSLAVFRRAQSAADQRLLPTEVEDYPGVREFGADPGRARSVETPEGPNVIVYPGKSGACLVVLYESFGSQGAGFSCKPYADIQRGTWLTTGTFKGKTVYVGLLPDGYIEVQARTAAGDKRHRVIDNVYSFVEDGDPFVDPISAQAVATNGSRTTLGAE